MSPSEHDVPTPSAIPVAEVVAEPIGPPAVPAARLRIPPWFSRFLPIGLPLFVALLISMPALQAGFHADDWALVEPFTWKEILGTFTGNWSPGDDSPNGFYRPLIRVSLALDGAVWRDNPFGYHLTNCFLFLLLVAAVFGSAFKLSSGHRWVSSAASLYVATFPYNSEAVAWISGRTDLLAVTFLAASLWAFLNFLEASSIRWFLVSLTLQACSLLTKEVALGSALILPLASILLAPASMKPVWRTASIIAPLAMGVLYYVARSRFIGGLGGYSVVQMEPRHVREIWGATSTFLSALASPLGGWGEASFPRWQSYVGCFAMGLLLVLTRLSRPVVFGSFAALISLAPMVVLGLAVTPSQGGRQLLLPMCLVALSLAAFFGSTTAGRWLRVPAAVVALLVFVSWGATSIQSSFQWAAARKLNDQVVTQAVDILEKNPKSTVYVYLENQDYGANRLLDPGTNGWHAIRCAAKFRGWKVEGLPVDESSTWEQAITTPSGAVHHLRLWFGPPTGKGDRVLAVQKDGSIQQQEIRSCIEIPLLVDGKWGIAPGTGAGTFIQVTDGVAVGTKLGAGEALRFPIELPPGRPILTGKAALRAAFGHASLAFAGGRNIDAPLGIIYPLDFWTIHHFQGAFPPTEGGKADLLWYPVAPWLAASPSQASIRFELQSLMVSVYQSDIISPGGGVAP